MTFQSNEKNVSHLNAKNCVSFNEEMGSSIKSAENQSGESVPIVVEEDNRKPSSVVCLSNRDRLLLRKQALKMKNRPVLAVGDILFLSSHFLIFFLFYFLLHHGLHSPSTNVVSKGAILKPCDGLIAFCLATFAIMAHWTWWFQKTQMGLCTIIIMTSCLPSISTKIWIWAILWTYLIQIITCSNLIGCWED